MLVRRNSYEWESIDTKKYKCSWLTKNKQQYFIFRIRKYQGEIIGDDGLVHQHLTDTKCEARRLYCIPQEQSLGMLVWRKGTHNAKLFHVLGEFEAHQVGQFVLVEKIGIAGSIINEMGQLLLLDNSYTLKKRRLVKTGNETEKKEAKFMKLAKLYGKRTTKSLQRELLEARIAAEFIKENRLMRTTAATLCALKGELYRLQLLNVHSFPDTVGQIIFEEPGKVIQPAGDAWLVKECLEIKDYEINWGKQINDTCYHLFPVKLSNGTKFLELQNRRLMSYSHKIECTNGTDELFIRDKKGSYWKYVGGNQFIRTKRVHSINYKEGLIMPKLASFNEKILVQSRTTPHRTTLLAMLADRQEELQEMADFKDAGEGSITRGIAGAMSTIFSSVVSVGEDVFQIVAGGIDETANVTVQAINDVGSTVSHVFDFTGGTPGFILYVLNFCIIGYLVYQRIHEGRRERIREAHGGAHAGVE